MVMECTEQHLRLLLADGTQTHSLELKPRATFKIGKATIRCIKRSMRPTVVVSDNPWDVRCPRCHETIADLSHDSGHCPKCNLEIHYFQSHADQSPRTTQRSFARRVISRVGCRGKLGLIAFELSSRKGAWGSFFAA